jgi:hypothetical protein
MLTLLILTLILISINGSNVKILKMWTRSSFNQLIETKLNRIN